MSSAWHTCKDGLRIPASSNPLRRQWDADYEDRVRDYFGTEGREFVPVDVPVDKLAGGHGVMPKNPRTDFYAKLYRCGKKEVPPVVVSDVGTGFFNVLDGNHRVLAAKMAGVTHVRGLMVRDSRRVKPRLRGPSYAYTATGVRRLGKSEESEDEHPDLAKSEVGVEKSPGAGADVPEPLPPRVASAMWALRQPGVLTDDLLATDGLTAHPAGHSFVPAEALYHIIDGRRTGWQLVRAQDGRCFLRHSRLGHVLDPATGDFDDPPDYDGGRVEELDTPSPRAAVVVDRARELMGGPPPAELAKKEDQQPRTITPGGLVYRSTDGQREEWDYSHLLPEDRRRDGYGVRLRVEHAAPVKVTGAVQPRLMVLASKGDQPVGQLVGSWNRRGEVQPWESHVEEGERGKRLGSSMYEALYAHARAHLGAEWVSGDYHSTSAHRVHKKLAAKYGLDYQAEPNVGRGRAYSTRDEWLETPEHDSDAKFGRYRYRLPGVQEPMTKTELLEKMARVDPTQNPEFNEWFEGSKAVDEVGKPLTVYHGTTHKFKAFGDERGHPENYYGRAHYFTSSPDDASQNYAGVGPDLKLRIETEVDRRDWNDGEVDSKKLRQRVERQLIGRHASVIPAYLRMRNPVVVRPNGGTTFHVEQDFDEDGEPSGEEHGNGVDLWRAIQTVGDLYGIDGQKVWSDITRGRDLLSGVTAHDVERELRSHPDVLELQHPETGHYASNEFVRDVWRELGHDGVVLDAHAAFGPSKLISGGRTDGMPAVTPGTRHYVVFEPNQVKGVFNQTFNQRAKDFGKAEGLQKDEVQHSPYFQQPDPRNYLTYSSPAGHHVVTPDGNEQWFPTTQERDKYLRWHQNLRDGEAGVRDLGVVAADPRHIAYRTVSGAVVERTPENTDVGKPLPGGGVVDQSMIKGSFGEGSAMAHPAFRHQGTGEVVVSPGFHNLDVLPAGSEAAQWVDGFVDQHGKFYDRQQALQAVSAPEEYRSEYGLESNAYRSAQAAGLLKVEGAALLYQHPNSYPWHDGNTAHHAAELNKADEQVKHPHADGAVPNNDQAAGVGVSTYAKFAAPYGTIHPGTKSNLLHYDYRPHERQVDDMVSRTGYQVYVAGGKYGRPDLANKNYNTGHLMIYDPSPKSGSDFGEEAYTRSWRKVHELAHALTYQQLNAKYGEGRRIGKLGVHRSPREAKRAVEWEWLAAHKQRELGEALGHHVPDDVFHRELNTVMHDAVHRAVTGQFTEPSEEGFVPHSHKVPLEHALGVIDEEARALGIQGGDDLAPGRMKKGELEQDAVCAVVVVQDGYGRTLWGRRRKDGKFVMPGGHAEPGEQPAHAALRELHEEAGLVPDSLYLLGVGRGHEGPVYVYYCLARGWPTPVNDPDREVSAWAFYDCLRGLPAEVASNLAHDPDLACSLMGWTQPTPGSMMEPMVKSEPKEHPHVTRLKSITDSIVGNDHLRVGDCEGLALKVAEAAQKEGVPAKFVEGDASWQEHWGEERDWHCWVQVGRLRFDPKAHSMSRLSGKPVGYTKYRKYPGDT